MYSEGKRTKKWKWITISGNGHPLIVNKPYNFMHVSVDCYFFSIVVISFVFFFVGLAFYMFYLHDFLYWIWFLFHNGFHVIVMMVVVVMLDFDPLFGFIMMGFANVVIVVMRFLSVHINHFLDFGTFGGRIFLIFWIDIADVFVCFGHGVDWTTIITLRISVFHWVHMDLTDFARTSFNDVVAGCPSWCFVRTGNIFAIGLGRIESNGRCYCNWCKYHQTKSLNKPNENTKIFAIIQKNKMIDH